MLWTYTILSVIIVSLVSLVGIFALWINHRLLDKMLVYFVSLSAGTLLGDAFIHLLPETYDGNGEGIKIPLYVLSGIVTFFVLEKFIAWQHCHEIPCDDHPHAFSYLIMIGDGLHNFIDGLIIAASYIVSIPVGIATTLAVILHEIPQEMGDYATLVYGGFGRMRALFFNFATALTAIVGALIVLTVSKEADYFTEFLVPFSAGGFVYIAGTDLIPELHKRFELKESIWQLAALVTGIGLMAGLLFLE